MTEYAFLGTSSGGGGCPTVYLSERGTLVVQGTTVTDPDAVEQIRAHHVQQHGTGVPAHESCVEIPAALLPFIDVDALARVTFGDTDRPEFQVDADAVERLRQVFTACAPERA